LLNNLSVTPLLPGLLATFWQIGMCLSAAFFSKFLPQCGHGTVDACSEPSLLFVTAGAGFFGDGVLLGAPVYC
jgi:hypothetical protein